MVTIEIAGVRSLQKTLEGVKKAIKIGIKDGSNELLRKGEKIAKDIVKPHNITGMLFNNIVVDTKLRSKIIYEGYLISSAPHSIFIEKGFKAHFVPIEYLTEWLASPKVNKAVVDYTLERGGIWMGPFEGIGFMDAAYLYMTTNAMSTYTKYIMNAIRMQVKLGGIK